MEAWLTDSVLSSLLVLILAVSLDALWRWPLSAHPLTLIRYLAENMGRRVCPDHDAPPVQHYISGSLGIAVLLVPLIILLALLVYLAHYPLFFEAVILVAMLDFGHSRQRFNQLLKVIGQDKKYLARETVAPLVARDCNTLTDIGIAKAAIESLLLRFYYQYCGVIFWFLLAGPIAALTYRLVLCVSWQWHYRRPGYYRFAQPARRLAKLLALPGACLGALLMMPVTGFRSSINGWRNGASRDFTSRLLALFGGALGIQLGGPAIYHGIKWRWARVGGARQVKYSDLYRARRAVRAASALFVALACTLLLMLWHINGRGIS